MLHLHQTNSRRQLLKFLGRSAAGVTLASWLPKSLKAEPKKLSVKVKGIEPTFKDDLVLAEGLKYETFLTWNQKINSKGDTFGYNNDYVAVIPYQTNHAWMWVNHEAAHPLFVTDWNGKSPRTKKQYEQEMKAVGGSIVHIKKVKDQWVPDLKNKHNRRIDGFTKIPLVAPRPIQGKTEAVGTLQNCAGGVTPWGTFLTCEENFQNHYGDYTLDKKGRRIEHKKPREFMGWRDHFPHPAEHYGWVVEVNPASGKAKKLTSLGRFCHECATTWKAKDGRCVVYTGDDKADQCVYKFISDKPNSLDTGTLYVADLKKGRWIPLTMDHPKLKKRFKDQTQILEYTRLAADLVGGTKLHRPEDIEIDPINKAVYVTQTNHAKKGDFFGKITKIIERDNNPLSLKFKSKTFLTGGNKTKFACPDNLAFDHKGNLWIASDMSEKFIGRFPYTKFKNNGLFYVPMSGPQAGEVIQVASAPVDAELTGICFSPDNKSLFLSVQHPGNKTKKRGEWTSHWPDGNKSEPRPSVVQITGELLDQLLG